MEALWRIELLGGLDAVRGDQRVTRFATQKFAALLAYLAFYRERPHGREELVAQLWPESAPEAGRRHLRVALTSLRRQLEPPGIPPGAVFLGTRQTLQLNPATCSTDVAAFGAAYREAERATDAPASTRTRLLAAAVEAYRGELLPGCGEEWVLPERQRLSELCCRALADLVRILVQAGDMSSALDYARRAVALDPLCEEARRDLIGVLISAGHSELALREYRDFEELLSRECGLTPLPATLALVAHLAGRRSAAVGAIEPRPAIQTPDCAPAATCSPTNRLPAGTVTVLLLNLEASIGTSEEERVQALIGEHGGHPLAGAGAVRRAWFGRASDASAAALGLLREWVCATLGGGPGPMGAVPDGTPACAGASLLPRLPSAALQTGEIELECPPEETAPFRLAKRLLRAAHPGQILTSETSAVLLRDDLPPGVRLVELGRYRLPGGDTPERLYSLEDLGLPLGPFLPPPAERDPNGSVPPTYTRFFGCEAEISALIKLIGGNDHGDNETRRGNGGSEYLRLVTLTGPGGSGKTRMALEAAHRLHERWRGAVWFVPLADLRDGPQVLTKLLELLRLQPSPQIEPLEQIGAFLSHQPALLILDNFEHLVEDAAPLVRTLLERVPALTALATSRRRLALEVEHELPVGPLPTPVESSVLRVEGSDKVKGSVSSDLSTFGAQSSTGVERSTLNAQLSTLSQCPSIQLFVDRAQAARPDFQLTQTNAAAVAALCRRLEGIPLAIELAAARSWALTPAQMLKRLNGRFELLVSRRHDTASRHRSLRAALDWSYQLLPPEVQRFFARLSIFRGGWSLEAAEAVCGEDQAFRRSGVQDRQSKSTSTSTTRTPERLNARTPERLNAPLDCLEQLWECSLIQTEELSDSRQWPPGEPPSATRESRGPGAPCRFTMLETLREYAAERLPAAERTAVGRRHAEYFLALVEADWTCPEARDEALDRERENLRAAMDWCQQAAAADAERSCGVEVPCALPGESGPARDSAGCEIGSAGGASSRNARSPESLTPLEIGLRLGRAWARYRYDRGSIAESRQRLGALLALPCGAPTTVRARALTDAGWLAVMHGEGAVGRALLEESLAQCRALGDREGIAEALNKLGLIIFEPEARAALYEESLAIWRERGNQGLIANALFNLSIVAQSQGDDERSRALAQESLELWREVGGPGATALPLCQLASLELGAGRLAQARWLFEEGLALFRAQVTKPRIAEILQNLGELALPEGDTERAKKLFTEALELNRDIEHRGAVGKCLRHLAEVSLQEGNEPAARPLFEQALMLCQRDTTTLERSVCLSGLVRAAQMRGDAIAVGSLTRALLALACESGEWYGLARCLETLAWSSGALAGSAREPERAARWLGAAAALRDHSRCPVVEALDQYQYRRLRAELTAALGEAAFNAAWEAGQRLTADAALGEALQVLPG